MANRERGEVSFEASSGKTWTLRYSTNALCELEDAVGKPIPEIVEALRATSASVKLMRSVFWAGLIDKHSGVDKKQAGDIMSDIGFDKAGELIGEALARAFPNKDGEDRPPMGGGDGAGAIS